MAQQWRPERNRHVAIVVDCGCASSALLGAPKYEEIDSIALERAPRLDFSIETALLLAALTDRAGDKVHLIVLDSAIHAHVSGIREAKIVEILAHAFTDISPRLDVIDWSEVVSTVEQTARHSTFIVIATKIPLAGMKTEFADALARLSNRHMVLVTSATDPGGIQTRAGREDAKQVFLAASASLAEQSDEAGTTDARLTGTLIVRASAGLLPARAAGRYIELKESSRL